MESVIESIDEAKEIARSILVERYPGTDDWFDIAWDIFLTHPQASDTPAGAPDAVLGITGKSDPTTREMARELAILFDTLVQKFPVLGDEVLARLEESGRKNGKPRTLMQTLRTSVEQMIPEQTGFVAWYRASDGQIVERTQGSHSQLARRFVRDDYDIFIEGNFAYQRIWNSKTRKRESVPVEITPTPLRVAVALLRYKGQELWVDEICAAGRRGAVSEKPLKPDRKEAAESAKVMVRRVKEAFNEVPHLEIKYVNESYQCLGAFSFCICVRKIFEPQFTLPGR